MKDFESENRTNYYILNTNYDLKIACLHRADNSGMFFILISIVAIEYICYNCK